MEGPRMQQWNKGPRRNAVDTSEEGKDIRQCFRISNFKDVFSQGIFKICMGQKGDCASVYIKNYFANISLSR
jgi:hypothetical protein